MLQLPSPLLGEISALTINTQDLDKSLQFYKKLGFRETFRADWPFPWIQVTDDTLLIMLRKADENYLALTYYVADIQPLVKELEGKGIKFASKPTKTDKIKRYLIESPDGMKISLVEMIQGFKKPEGKDMLHMNAEDYFKPETYTNKTAGMFGELAHNVKDLQLSIIFWQKLGFRLLSQYNTPSKWAIMSDGISIIGLHENATFDKPAITFFAADMVRKLAALKNNELPGIEQQSKGNAQVETPEGQLIFLYQLGGIQETEKPFPETQVIETERLLLKMYTPEIMNELFEHYTDEEIIKFHGYTTEEELETERMKWKGGMTTYRISFRGFIMFEKATGKRIGLSGFHNWYDMHKRAEIGYALKSSEFYGKGYMKEALKPIIAHGFNEMNLNRMEAFVGPNNIASQRLVLGAGFTKEGQLRQHFFVNGIYDDSICYGLLRSEYFTPEQ